MTEKFAPVMAWHPETGENRIFNYPSEVPADWLDTHPNNVVKPKADPDMTKDEIMAALTEGGVQFDPKAKTKVLAATLRSAVEKALVSAEIDFGPDQPTKELLALLPPPE